MYLRSFNIKNQEKKKQQGKEIEKEGAVKLKENQDIMITWKSCEESTKEELWIVSNVDKSSKMKPKN